MCLPAGTLFWEWAKFKDLIRFVVDFEPKPPIIVDSPLPYFSLFVVLLCAYTWMSDLAKGGSGNHRTRPGFLPGFATLFWSVLVAVARDLEAVKKRRPLSALE
jgi:hypothetical protein